MTQPHSSTVSVSRDAGDDIPVRPGALWYSPRPLRSHDVIALIPVWNAENHIQITLNSLVGAVDAVIALDDGSTDKSQKLLRAHPLVVCIVSKPLKPLQEWHDARNRHELHMAAARFAPAWVLCIDSDERMDPCFRAYRSTLTNAYRNISAYAFHVVDVCEGRITRERFGHRMYRYSAGATFDRRRLHCRLIPLEITPEEVKLTNIRIYHDIGTDVQRRANYEKYIAADPTCRWQSSYDHLLGQETDKPLVVGAGRLELGPVIEDGCQRRLLPRRLVPTGELDPADHQSRMQQLSQTSENLVEDLRRYHDLCLDAFVVVEAEGCQYVAAYCYESTRDLLISPIEAWFIEQYRETKDFYVGIVRLSCFLGVSVHDAAARFIDTMDSLTNKGVLRLPARVRD